MQSISGINAIGNLSVTGQLPTRPAYGTQGKRISVYANYFRLQATPNLSLTRYNVEVAPEATGKKLKRIFQLILELPQFAGVATEWKAMIIARQPLNIPDGFTVEIKYRAEGQDEPLERATTYKIRVVTPTTLAVSDLVKYLSTTSTGPAFPQQAEVIQAVNALLGHHPQSHDGVTSIGQNRHFLLSRSETNARNIQILGGGLESLRGFFQSARPATGGILLNVNVTHGVFFEPLRLDMLYPKLGTGNTTTLQKKLKRVRVEVIHLPAKKSKNGQTVPRVKTIFGLADRQDGRSEEHPPQVECYAAGPRQVKFWLSAVPPAATAAAAAAGGKPPGKGKGGKQDAGPQLPANTYITVFEYFRKSKRRLLLHHGLS